MSLGCMEGHKVSLPMDEPKSAMDNLGGQSGDCQLDIGPGDTTVPVWLQIQPGTLVSHPNFHSVLPFLHDENCGDL